MLILATKRSSETLRYTIDWSDRLGGDTLSGAPTVTVTGAVLDAQTADDHSVTVKISGGSAGTLAKIEASATTAAGDTIDDVAVLMIGFDAIDLATAKAAQRIEANDEDVLLGGFLRAAIGYVERATGKKLTPTIVTQVADGFPGSSAGRGYARGYAFGDARDGAIRLWKGPVSAIVAVEYDDGDGVAQALESFRLVDGANARLLPAFGECWPWTAPGPGTVRLTYVAGYDVGELPPELEQAAIMLFGHFNANREAVIASDRAAAVELPLGVEMMIGPYRPIGLA